METDTTERAWRSNAMTLPDGPYLLGTRSHPIPNQKAEAEFSTTKLRNNPSLEKHTISRANSGVHPVATWMLLSQPAAPASWPLFRYLKKNTCFCSHSESFWNFLLQVKSLDVPDPAQNRSGPVTL